MELSFMSIQFLLNYHYLRKQKREMKRKLLHPLALLKFVITQTTFTIQISACCIYHLHSITYS